MRTCIVLLITVLLSIAQYSQAAQKDTQKTLTQLSLDELLNVEVTIAGKNAQKISATPAIVSVITADDIQKMGATNLYEVLSYIPGINLSETFFGFTSVAFRGNLQSHYNNKSLLLINNHPVYEAITGSYYLEQMPLAMVKRIEIIRGPGSTLYGSDAFAGVIKIITNTADDMDGSGTVYAGGGSFTTAFGGFAYCQKVGQLGVAVGGENVNSTGYPFVVKSDENRQAGTLDFKDNYSNGFASFNFHDFTLNIGDFNADRDKYGVIAALQSTGDRSFGIFFSDLNFSQKIGSDFEISAMAYFDCYYRRENIDWWPPAPALKYVSGSPIDMTGSSNKMGLEVQGAYSIAPDTRLLAGVVYEKQHTDPLVWRNADTGLVDNNTSAYITAYGSYDFSGYIQADTCLFKKLGMVAGVRLNANQDYGTTVTPRFGLVYNVITPLAIKVLYGNAFRNPNFFEKYVSTLNVLYGDENLKPEKISSLDIGIDWLLNSRNSLRVNYFFDSTSNLIGRSAIISAGVRGATVDSPGYANGPGQKISGLECEIKGSFDKHIFYFVNVSYISGSEKNSAASSIMFIPHCLANSGVNYNLDDHLSASAYVQYVGPKSGVLTNGQLSTMDAYALLNLILNYRAGKNLTFSLIGKNLSSTQYSYPEYIRRVVADVPGGPGSACYGMIRFDF